MNLLFSGQSGKIDPHLALVSVIKCTMSVHSIMPFYLSFLDLLNNFGTSILQNMRIGTVLTLAIDYNRNALFVKICTNIQF